MFDNKIIITNETVNIENGNINKINKISFSIEYYKVFPVIERFLI